MYQAHGFIRDYDPSSDTATVELTGIGAIDTWITGLKVHIGVKRAALAYGIPCVVEMPDQHRLCEAHVVSLGDPATGSALTTVNGRTLVGYGANTTIPFGHTFTNPPSDVQASADGKVSCTISSITTTQFNVTIGAGSGNTYVTWSATGT